MAARRNTAKQRSESAPPAEPERTSDGEVPDISDPYAFLGTLQAGDVVSVTRQLPVSHQGWLGHIEIAPENAHELPQLIKDQWGGGRYLLQWKQRGPGNARLKFRPGGAVISIVGKPKNPEEPVALPVAPPPYPWGPQPPPQAAASSGMEQHLLNLLGGVIERVGGDASKVDVVGLVGKLQETLAVSRPVAPAVPQDAFAGAERLLTLMAKLQDFTGGLAPREQAAGGGGVTGMGSGIEQMMLAKLMGDGNPQQPAQGIPPPPSPQHMYHPQMGWVIPGHRPQAQPQRQPQAQPQAQPMGQPEVQPQAQAQPQAQPQDEENPPLTPEDLAEEVENMSQEEQTRFIKCMSALYAKQNANGSPPPAFDLGPPSYPPADGEAEAEAEPVGE